MVREPSPWYWPERNGWFTLLNNSRHPLGEHPVDLPPPQKRKGKWIVPPPIDTASHSLLAAPPAADAMRPAHCNPVGGAGLTVSEVLDKFLDWTQKAPRTYEWYRDHLQSFLNHLGKEPLPVADLRPFHVVEWIDGHAD